MARYLIEKAADANHGNIVRAAPLFYAIAYERADVAKLLLDAGLTPLWRRCLQTSGKKAMPPQK